MGIKTVEDVLIVQAKAALTPLSGPLAGQLAVRAVVAAPGDWDKDMLKRRLLAMVPCVLIVFAGGPSTDAGATTAAIEAHWRVIAATGGPNEEARRAGDSQFIGAYEMVEALIAQLDGFTVPDVGTLNLLDVENLYSGEIDKQGLSIYGLTFTHRMEFSHDLDLAALPHFETFHAMFDIPPFDGEPEYQSWLEDDFSTSKPDAEDTVTLPA
jgi:phage gp37-like protein